MIDLRLGDALGPHGLAALGDGAVDVTIADPPFDGRTHRAALEAGDWRARDGRRRVAGALPFPPWGPAEIATAAAQLARVTRRWILVFAADRQLEAWAAALELAGARFVRLGIAERTNPRPQMSGDRPAPAADLLVIAHGAGVACRWNGGGKAARWAAPAARWDEGGQVHPTQKPLAPVRALVEDFTDPGELVLDPTAGAGTVAVACKELGRRFVGWELDPAFHAAALARLERTREQLRLGEARLPRRRRRPVEQLGLGLLADHAADRLDGGRGHVQVVVDRPVAELPVELGRDVDRDLPADVAGALPLDDGAGAAGRLGGFLPGHDGTVAAPAVGCTRRIDRSTA